MRLYSTDFGLFTLPKSSVLACLDMHKRDPPQKAFWSVLAVRQFQRYIAAQQSLALCSGLQNY
ncbi:hypothetical protein DB34_00655 [Acetobacter pasteurianus]|nr:hypothetical protein DB34_00655 [Acetobacter pasteurianus]